MPSPGASLGLRPSGTSCVSKAPVGRQSRAQQHYMVAAPAKEEGTVAAVPHGGTLVDLNLKTDEEKKVRSAILECWVGISPRTTILRLQPTSPPSRMHTHTLLQPAVPSSAKDRAESFNLGLKGGMFLLCVLMLI